MNVICASEIKRKILHMGLGVTALSFPWVFNQTWEVVVVCMIIIAGLLLMRFIPILRNSIGNSIYNINRFSVGELLFAISIILLFQLSSDNLALYILPLGILTFSDAIAAIVGTYYAKTTKSWEGSIAFMLVTFVILLSVLSVVNALGVAIVLSIIEARSFRGFDNLFVPMGAYFFLKGLI